MQDIIGFNFQVKVQLSAIGSDSDSDASRRVHHDGVMNAIILQIT